MTEFKVIRETCNGFGNCVLSAPDVFDLDDEGLVVLKRQPDSAEELAAARRGAYDCPTDSIEVVED